MNEEFLRRIYDHFNLSEKGSFEKFATDMRGSEDLQKKVWEKLGGESKGSFDKFQTDLGITPSTETAPQETATPEEPKKRVPSQKDMDTIGQLYPTGMQRLQQPPKETPPSVQKPVAGPTSTGLLEDLVAEQQELATLGGTTLPIVDIADSTRSEKIKNRETEYAEKYPVQEFIKNFYPSNSFGSIPRNFEELPPAYQQEYRRQVQSKIEHDLDFENLTNIAVSYLGEEAREIIEKSQQPIPTGDMTNIPAETAYRSAYFLPKDFSRLPKEQRLKVVEAAQKKVASIPGYSMLLGPQAPIIYSLLKTDWGARTIPSLLNLPYHIGGAIGALGLGVMTMPDAAAEVSDDLAMAYEFANKEGDFKLMRDYIKLLPPSAKSQLTDLAHRKAFEAYVALDKGEDVKWSDVFAPVDFYERREKAMYEKLGTVDRERVKESGGLKPIIDSQREGKAKFIKFLKENIEEQLMDESGITSQEIYDDLKTGSNLERAGTLLTKGTTYALEGFLGYMPSIAVGAATGGYGFIPMVSGMHYQAAISEIEGTTGKDIEDIIKSGDVSHIGPVLTGVMAGALETYGFNKLANLYGKKQVGDTFLKTAIKQGIEVARQGYINWLEAGLHEYNILKAKNRIEGEDEDLMATALETTSYLFSDEGINAGIQAAAGTFLMGVPKGIKSMIKPQVLRKAEVVNTYDYIQQQRRLQIEGAEKGETYILVKKGEKLPAKFRNVTPKSETELSEGAKKYTFNTEELVKEGLINKPISIQEINERADKAIEENLGGITHREVIQLREELSAINSGEITSKIKQLSILAKKNERSVLLESLESGELSASDEQHIRAQLEILNFQINTQETGDSLKFEGNSVIVNGEQVAELSDKAVEILEARKVVLEQVEARRKEQEAKAAEQQAQQEVDDAETIQDVPLSQITLDEQTQALVDAKRQEIEQNIENARQANDETMLEFYEEELSKLNNSPQEYFRENNQQDALRGVRRAQKAAEAQEEEQVVEDEDDVPVVEAEEVDNYIQQELDDLEGKPDDTVVTLSFASEADIPQELRGFPIEKVTLGSTEVQKSFFGLFGYGPKTTEINEVFRVTTTAGELRALNNVQESTTEQTSDIEDAVIVEDSPIEQLVAAQQESQVEADVVDTEGKEEAVEATAKALEEAETFHLVENEGEWKATTKTYRGREIGNWAISNLDKKQQKEYLKIKDEANTYGTKEQAEENLKKLKDFEQKNKKAFEQAKQEIDALKEAEEIKAEESKKQQKIFNQTAQELDKLNDKDFDKLVGLIDEKRRQTLEQRFGDRVERRALFRTPISEAYHADKAAGKETELVKAVEELLGKKPVSEQESAQQEVPAQEAASTENVLYETPKQRVREQDGQRIAEYKKGEQWIAYKNQEGDAAKKLFDKVPQTTDGVTEGVTQKEKAEIAERIGKSLKVKPKNIKGLLDVMSNIFGLNKKQAESAAAIGDALVGTMAERAGISKDEMYQRIAYRKAELKDLPNGVKMQVDAWHGSPHLFDKFTTQAIGTGEGAQAFGWGLYFTDLESIARNYAETLGSRENAVRIQTNMFASGIKDNDPRDFAIDIRNELINGKNPKDVAKIIEDKYGVNDKTSSLIKALKDNDVKVSLPKNTSKNIYKVSLHKGKTPDQYTWLEWDKPVSEEIYEQLNEVLRPKNQIGSQLYESLSETLGGDKNASEYLLDLGIDGIKYPAESIARGATSDNARGFNYVVFDENAVSIEEVIKFQKDALKARGAMMTAMDAQATIFALTDPNVSTPMHELAHVYEHYLTDAEKTSIQKWAGTEGWTTETSEKFARGFEKYLSEGKSPTPSLQQHFDNFKNWLLEIYNNIVGSEIDITLNSEMRAIYDSMLTTEKTELAQKKKALDDAKKAFTESLKKLAKTGPFGSSLGIMPNMEDAAYNMFMANVEVVKALADVIKAYAAHGAKLTQQQFDRILKGNQILLPKKARIRIYNAITSAVDPDHRMQVVTQTLAGITAALDKLDTQLTTNREQALKDAKKEIQSLADNALGAITLAQHKMLYEQAARLPLKEAPGRTTEDRIKNLRDAVSRVETAAEKSKNPTIDKLTKKDKNAAKTELETYFQGIKDGLAQGRDMFKELAKGVKQILRDNRNGGFTDSQVSSILKRALDVGDSIPKFEAFVAFMKGMFELKNYQGIVRKAQSDRKKVLAKVKLARTPVDGGQLRDAMRFNIADSDFVTEDAKNDFIDTIRFARLAEAAASPTFVRQQHDAEINYFADLYIKQREADQKKKKNAQPTVASATRADNLQRQLEKLKAALVKRLGDGKMLTQYTESMKLEMEALLDVTEAELNDMVERGVLNKNDLINLIATYDNVVLEGTVTAGFIQAVRKIRVDRASQLARKATSGKGFKRRLRDILGLSSLFNPSQTSREKLQALMNQHVLSRIDAILDGKIGDELYKAFIQPISIPLGALREKGTVAFDRVAKAREKVSDVSNIKLAMMGIQRQHLRNPQDPTTPSLEQIMLKIEMAGEAHTNFTATAKAYKAVYESLKTNGVFDYYELERNLSKNERALWDEVNAQYQNNKDMIEVAAARNEQGVSLKEAYSPFKVMMQESFELQDLLSQASNFAQGTVPSVGALHQRTAGAKPLYLDFAGAAIQNGRELLQDFYLREPLKVFSQTLNKILNDPTTTAQERDFYVSLGKAIENQTRAVFVNNYLDQYSWLTTHLKTTGYQAALASIPRGFIAEFLSNATFAGIVFTRSIFKGAETYVSKALGMKEADMDEFIRLMDFTQPDRLIRGAGSVMSDAAAADIGSVIGQTTNIAKKAAKKAFKLRDKFNYYLVEKGDTVIAKPLVIGAALRAYKRNTGEDLDIQRFIHDKVYRRSNRKEFNKARDEADRALSQGFATFNQFEGIVDATVRKDDNFWRMYDKFLTRFARTEFQSMADAGRAIMGEDANMSRFQGLLLATGTIVRMGVYTVLARRSRSMFYNFIGTNLIGLPDDTEDEPGKLAVDSYKAFLGAALTLAVGRRMGNLGRLFTMAAIESANYQFGHKIGLREAEEYQLYEDFIVFSLLNYANLKDLSSYSLAGKVLETGISVSGPYQTLADGIYGLAKNQLMLHGSSTPDVIERQTQLFWGKHLPKVILGGVGGLAPNDIVKLTNSVMFRQAPPITMHQYNKDEAQTKLDKITNQRTDDYDTVNDYLNKIEKTEEWKNASSDKRQKMVDKFTKDKWYKIEIDIDGDASIKQKDSFTKRSNMLNKFINKNED